MTEPQQGGARRLESFEDLANVSDEVLRQIAMRVHVVELAYAFGGADGQLRDRLLGVVRQGLANEIRSSLRTIEAAGERFPYDVQARSARARVVEVARLILDTQPG